MPELESNPSCTESKGDVDDAREGGKEFEASLSKSQTPEKICSCSEGKTVQRLVNEDDGSRGMSENSSVCSSVFPFRS